MVEEELSVVEDHLMLVEDQLMLVEDRICVGMITRRMSTGKI